MAKYVNYVPEMFHIIDINNKKITFWWFDTSFSQSALGDRKIDSEACTLIATMIAGRIDSFDISIYGYPDQPLNKMLITSIAEAIIDGNEIHDVLRTSGHLIDTYLTVPEALNAAEHKFPQITEWLEMNVVVQKPRGPLGLSIANNMRECIENFERSPPTSMKEGSNLYIILITAYRSVLFCYQLQTSRITLIDSHYHMRNRRRKGAVVAQVGIDDLNSICRWYADVLIPKKDQRTSYELAFLYSKPKFELQMK